MQRIRFSRYTEGYIEPMTLSSHAPHQPPSARHDLARTAIYMECGTPVPLLTNDPRRKIFKSSST